MKSGGSSPTLRRIGAQRTTETVMIGKPTPGTIFAPTLPDIVMAEIFAHPTGKMPGELRRILQSEIECRGIRREFNPDRSSAPS